MLSIIYKDISLFIYFINNLFSYIEVINNSTIFIILLKCIRLEVLDELDNIIVFIINIIINSFNNCLGDVNNIIKDIDLKDINTINIINLYRFIVDNPVSLLETRLLNRITIYSNNIIIKKFGNLFISYNI
jgi:hypothetical protein